MIPKHLPKYGVKPDPVDLRDFRAGIAIKAIPLPQEYSLKTHISRIEDQGESGSCTAQAFAYYAEVLNSIETQQSIQLSPRDIYSLVHLPDGGAYLRDAAAKIVKSGVIPEADAPSYINSNPPTEAFMRQRNDITPEEIEKGNTYLAKSYVKIDNVSVEGVKQAVFQNHGCVLAAFGENDNWQTAVVKPGKTPWAHAVYACGWKRFQDKDYIQFVNSWGKDWGENGFGYMGEDYFKARQVFNPWTLMDFPNEYYETLKKQATLLARLVVLYKQLIELLKVK